jgi:hypothetical protein
VIGIVKPTVEELLCGRFAQSVYERLFGGLSMLSRHGKRGIEAKRGQKSMLSGLGRGLVWQGLGRGEVVA